MMTMFDTFYSLTRSGQVATITLNRPEARNTWNPAMGPLLEEAMLGLDADPDVRAIVITGAGDFFCAGADVGALKTVQETKRNPFPPRPRTDDDLNQRYSYLLGLRTPVICALNGPAVGIGMVLPVFSDIRYAVAGTRMSIAFARRGLVAEHGIAWMLPRLIGASRATEWLLTGRMITAEEAAEAGLIHAVLPAEGFHQAVAERAADIAQTVSPRTVAIIKRQIWQGLHQPLAQAIHMAEDEVPGCLDSDDFREGILHFLEKRPARFTGQ